MKRFGLSAILAATLAISAAPAAAQQQLSIATGGTGGVYYPLGGGFAELINRHIDGYSAVAEVTGASVENMALVHSGDSDMAIALGDTVSQAYRGEGQFQNRRAPGLRALASLYPNAVQIVLPGNSTIRSLADLKGKRVSVGAPGSGTEVNARVLFESNGVTYADLAAAQRLNFNETADALRDGDIDAGVWSVGPPTSSIMNLAASRSIKLLSLSPEEVAKARAAEPIFAEFTLPKGIYDGVAEDVRTVGIPNVLVVNADMSDDLAYRLTKLLYERVDDLIAIHSAARDTTVDFTLGSSPIPLHPGALRYYQEIGASVPAQLRP
ncbi:TAXI family TRAP transporter solute-binding subunit [Pseudothauera nasutitermitis]|uniref:TAXI family TRAP transporter solute-binding subunit n=1 Tax=Pseudothauera nasutitermitis TaxID=2565930 RepID=A0A4S4AZD2_9RHOO|nr:TAXI family TRAP transporter solute-binding subunit [Pseudothauera nasutitermitis]THF63982.1 TAXI family TRAP transporter solute-binding subunit [Pseudothauera nasutitermitis]